MAMPYGIQMIDYLEPVLFFAIIINAAEVDEVIEVKVRGIMKEPADLEDPALSDRDRDLSPEIPDSHDFLGETLLQLLCNL
jgi:hypothetical protein